MKKIKQLNWDGNYKQPNGDTVNIADIQLEYSGAKKKKEKNYSWALGSLVRFLMIHNVKFLDETFYTDKSYFKKEKKTYQYFSMCILKRKKGESYNIENLAIEFNKLTSSNLKKK